MAKTESPYDAVGVPIIITDTYGTILYLNRAAQVETGFRGNELSGVSLLELAADPESRLALEQAYTADSRLYRCRSMICCADDSLLAVEARLQATLDGTREIIVCTLLPVRDESELYRQTFERNLSMKFLIDPETGMIFETNEAAAAFYGMTPDEMRSSTIYAVNTAPREVVDRNIQRAIKGIQNVFEVENVAANGEVRTVQVMAAPLEYRGKQLLYSVFVDVTEQAQLRKALEQSEALYNRIVSMIQQAVVVEDRHWNIVHVNDAFCAMVGYPAEELIGRNMFDLVDDSQHRLLEQETVSREHGDASLYDLTFRTKRGFPRYTVVSATPIYDNHGEFNGSFAVITDLTEYKIVEDALRASNAELDAFSHTVAHDLKDPLSTIITYTEIMNYDEQKIPEPVHNYINAVGYNAHKLLTIIDELLLLSQTRGAPVKKTPLDMGQIVDEALNRLRYVIDQSEAEISITVENWTPTLGYASWIESIWVNYISNAIKYGGRPPHITLGEVPEGDGHIRYYVRDNGSGLNEAQQARLFLPFERLKDESARGHGIGLSIVRRIAEKLGGRVGVDSEPDEGSTFYFILPRATDETN